MINESKAVINIETRKEFKSITQAALFFGLHAGSVSNVCNGLAFSARGFRFCFADEYDAKNYENDKFELIETNLDNGQHFYTVERPKRKYNSGKDHGKSRAVIDLDSGRVFDTVTEAARELGLTQCGISAVLTGLQKTHRKRRFAYARG
jgi:hypothetical protein